MGKEFPKDSIETYIIFPVLDNAVRSYLLINTSEFKESAEDIHVIEVLFGTFFILEANWIDKLEFNTGGIKEQIENIIRAQSC